MTADSLRKSIDYLNGPSGVIGPLFLALCRAEDQVSRLDERARLSEFADGWRARADVRAVIGGMWAAGELVHPEDLLLHASDADTRVPDPSTQRAWAALRARRKAWRGGDELLSWRGVAWLSGRIADAPPPAERPSARPPSPSVSEDLWAALEAFFARLGQGVSDGARAGVEDCLALLDFGEEVPALLLAAALLEAWRLVDPLPTQRFAGSVLAGLFLRSRRRFGAALFPVEVAMRRRRMSQHLEWAPLADRLVYWLELFALAADLELEELVRLGHQKARVDRIAGLARRHSKAGALAALLVEYPVVTSELVSNALGVTPQASLQLLKRFSGTVQELTGRSHYRVWRL